MKSYLAGICFSIGTILVYLAAVSETENLIRNKTFLHSYKSRESSQKSEVCEENLLSDCLNLSLAMFSRPVFSCFVKVSLNSGAIRVNFAVPDDPIHQKHSSKTNFK